MEYYLHNFIQLLGAVGSIAMSVCSIPQVAKTIRNKNSDGISRYFLWLWLFSEVTMAIFTAGELGGPWQLMITYYLNILAVCIILYYKYRPQRLIRKKRISWKEGKRRGRKPKNKELKSA